MGTRLEDHLERMANETALLRRDLSDFILRQAAILEGEIFEVCTGALPPSGGGAVTDGAGVQGSNWEVQTAGVEVITGLIAITPVGTTVATLTLGRVVLPVQNTTLALSPILFKLLPGDKRQLVYTAPANATIGSLVILWGHYGRSEAPGRLH